MTEINPFAGLGLARPVADNSARAELGQEDFMTLMIAQFRNQDPFAPMENGEFLGQLAQFGTVSGIDELNGAFAGLQASIQSEQALQAANLVGRNVLAETGSGYLATGGAITGAVELPTSGSYVQVEIEDANGQLVRRLDLGQHPGGLVAFEWDGRDASGVALDSGEYRVRARFVRGNEVEGAPVLIESRIDSVTLGRGGAGLVLNLDGGAELDLNRVRRIT